MWGGGPWNVYVLISDLDKREYLMIIVLVSHRNHVVSPHLNRLIETG